MSRTALDSALASKRSFRPAILTVLAVVFLCATTSATAVAQDQAAIEKLVQLNKKAMDDYDTADFDVAKKSLLEAEKVGKRAGLESHPIMARTYVHLGALYWMGYKDNKKAQHYMGKALDIQNDIKLDKNLTSSSLKQLFAKVQEQRGGAPVDEEAPADDASSTTKKKGRGPVEETVPATDAESSSSDESSGKRKKSKKSGGASDDVEPELPASIQALDCPYADETLLAKKVTLRCAAAANLGVEKVLLFYKGFEMSAFETLEMTKSSKGWWQATIPKKRVEGKSLQFYFEGNDASDKPVVSNGRAESPNVMLIVETLSAGGATGSSEEEDENPLEAAKRRKVALGRHDDSQDGLDTHYGNRRFWIGIGLGTGVTFAINGVPESRVRGYDSQKPDQIVSGAGWAGLGQATPELGIQITPRFAISVQGRNQWIPQDKKVATYTASGAHSALLRFLIFSKQSRFRTVLGGVVGGGEGVRMNIYSDPSNPLLKDTIRIGGVLFGGTAGINFEISRGMSWMAEVNAMYGLPKSGLAFDFNTGLQFNFGDSSDKAEKEAQRRSESVSTSVDDEDPK